MSTTLTPESGKEKTETPETCCLCMELSTAIGIIAGSLTAVSALPQVFKVLKNKKAADVSPWMFVVLMAGNVAWVCYGILLEEWPIIITNLFSFCVDVLMIILNFNYAGKK